MLLDRLAERAALNSLLGAARDGRSGVLVLPGPPGIGKTALLDNLTASAADMRIARVAGVESEMELAFAALQQLCAPMLEAGLGRLPDPQRDALGVAFGLRAGEAPDRFLVGLAALSLLSATAEQQPLLCVIDDAQWLDRVSAQVLAFVARRLLAEPIALVIATREPGEDFHGLPELPIHGLASDDARELLCSVIKGPLDERVREQIIAETHGNPLALMELPHGLTPAELAGGFGLPDALALPDRIEDSFRRRLEALPVPAQRLLLVAAAEPTGDPVLMWRAAGRLGIGAEAAAAAEAGGLLTMGGRVTFRHPLARSAAYRAAATAERRAAHQALADATDPRSDPERRAWHRAQATAGHDEEVAEELERSAGRAQARGGVAAAAAFLEGSAALTLDPGRRAGRALAAAQAKFQAGALDAALGLLAAVEAGPLDESQLARVDLLHGQIAFAARRGNDAPPLLLKAARKLEPLDPRLARETYLDALAAAIFAARLAVGGGLREVAEAARAAPRPQPARGPDLLLDGLVRLICAGHTAGVPVLKEAVRTFRSTDISRYEGLRWMWLACHAAGIVWDYESWDVLSARQVTLARETGSLTTLPIAFNTRSGVHLFAGEFTEAAAMAAEAESVSETTGSSIAPYGALALAVFRGLEGEAAALIGTTRKDVEHRGEGEGLTFANWATAVLYNGLARYKDALAAAEQATEDLPVLWFTKWALAELIEAAVRSGVPGRAASALERLSDAARVCGTDWALGIEARSRALVTGGEAAEELYREAVDRLGRTRLRVELARAQLLYGEWLRRHRRSRDARDQLRSAHEAFDSIGAGGFAERARAELRASGGYPRGRATGQRDPLTAQEALVAHLAGGGASNAEVAAQLFISPATVAYHLRKVFAKLGITSRSQLGRTLPAQSEAALPVRPRG